MDYLFCYFNRLLWAYKRGVYLSRGLTFRVQGVSIRPPIRHLVLTYWLTVYRIIVSLQWDNSWRHLLIVVLSYRCDDDCDLVTLSVTIIIVACRRAAVAVIRKGVPCLVACAYVIHTCVYLRGVLSRPRERDKWRADWRNRGLVREEVREWIWFI